MRKTSNNTQFIRKSSKIRTHENKPKNEDLKISVWLEDYMDLFSLKMKPVTQGFIERLSKELLEWADKEDSLILKRFYTQKKIPREAFYRWVNKYPELKLAYEHTKESIAHRRELGGMTRKFDPGFILQSMPMYDSDWKEFMQWKSSLKANETNNEKVVIEINDLSKKVDIITEGKNENE